MAREYKDSGIEWIGRIPKDWKVCSLSQMAKEHYISNKNIHNQNLLSLSYGKIVNKNINTTDGLLPASFDTYQIVEDGNIVLRLTDLQNDQRSLRVGLSTQKGIITSAYLALEAMSLVLPKYLHYQLHSADIKKVFYSMGNGVRQNLNWVELRKLNCILPSLDEQQAIASYLDKKCAEIDSLVELQEQMIAQLTDYKQSVITGAVTKGLNPEAELVSSGIDWIGDVPKTWNTQRLKFLCTIQTGNQDTQDSDPVGIYPFYVRSPIVERSNKYSFEGEGILMAGDGAGAGRVFHHVYGKYAVHQRVYRLANIKGINSDFLFYFLSSLFCKEMDRGSAQSTVPSVRLPMLQNFSVCIPSVEEQNDIVSLLDAKCHEIDTLISIKRQKIETLKDYKKSIIFEAVTGKTNID